MLRNMANNRHVGFVAFAGDLGNQVHLFFQLVVARRHSIIIADKYTAIRGGGPLPGLQGVGRGMFRTNIYGGGGPLPGP